ncbi:MAG: histidine phosphatase family protein [Chloroflexota bacterium]|nr:histidine phosphatase family protein [Chloroflexota bacterium]
MIEASTPIILIRHGQTAWNKKERFRGRADLPLDETGIRQAKAASEKLANCGASAIYSSPLQRTLMTAQPIADKLGLTIKPADDLIDIDYGAWQGLSTEEALAENEILYRKWLESPHEASFPDGEGLSDVRARVIKMIDKVLSEHSGQTVILVSHVVVCRVFICTVLGLDDSHFWQIEQDVNAINTIGMREGKLTLNSLNDTCHLKGLS